MYLITWSLVGGIVREDYGTFRMWNFALSLGWDREGFGLAL